ncbi:MAG TPA: SCO6880 family protein [Mycobacteriales bacterium]|nr:SCO6880 family protein [Mycobacteriales bacterium]
MTAQTATSGAPPPLTYTLATAGSSGVWLGMGIARVAVLGIGLTASIVALSVGAPLPLAVVCLLAAVLMAGSRAAGRPLLDWAAPIGAHLAARTSATSRWRGQVPTLPSAVAEPTRLHLPVEFGRPVIQACPGEPAIGMIIDRSTRSVTAVLDVCGVDRFPLLDATDRDALLAGWGESLAVLADTDEALVRLQLIDRAQARSGDVAFCPTNELALGARDEISALATRRASRLAAQWSFPRLGVNELATVSARVRLLCQTLFGARLLARPLTAAQIATDLTASLDGHSRDSDLHVAGGPLSRRIEWTHVQVDDRLHRTFAVTGWPTSPVSAAWLSPLMLAAPQTATCTVSFHLERVTPAAAARLARSRRAKAALDQTDRARFGMTSSAALHQAEAAGVAMDGELAAGYRTHRLAGLVSLAADSVDALDDAGRMLRQAAAVCRLDLRPLHGQHDVALAACVPLCRLRTRGSG